MKNVVNKISLILLILAALMLTACGNLFSSGSENSIEPSATGETYISIKFNNHPRTISSTAQFTKNEFTNIELMGAPYYSGEGMKRLAYAETMPTEGLTAKITDGKWALALYASYNGIVFYDYKEVELIANTNNTVRFELKATEHYGGCDITYKVPEQVAKAKITIKKASNESLVWEEEILAVTAENPEDGKVVRFSKLPGQLMDDNTKLRLFESGTYLMTFEFFGGHDDYGYTLLNTNESYLVISDAKITTAEIALDFNELYRINYYDEMGDICDITNENFFAGVVVSAFSKKSNFDLPRANKYGKIFTGWQLVSPAGTNKTVSKIPDDIDFTDDDFDVDSNGKHTVLNLHAQFIDPVLYVADNTTSDATCVVTVGSDENSGYDENHQLKTISKAFEIIRNLGTPEMAWTIQISGILPSAEITEDDISADYAKSLTLNGKLGPDASNIPQDRFDGKKAATSLTISTPVPVTITNLKLTNGKIGLNVAQEATVALGDGVLICGNMQSSNSRGGGVHNEGTLFMYGTAVVGLKNPTTWASPSSSEQYVYGSSSQEIVSGNYATSGGGIYNGQNNTIETVVAKLYLGYSGFKEDGITPIKATLTGGVFANGASEGAGVYNAPNCRFYYDSGIIKWNDAASSGAGIYNNKGIVEMTGGQIINNRALWPSYTTNCGGGVYNYHNSARFIMSGGVITDNTATSNGGGIYNGGKVYLYGEAVIGNQNADTVATEDSFGNKGVKGGGIFNDGQNYGGIDYNYRGELYIGYEPGTDGVTPVKADYTGGIYQNYSTFASSTDYHGGGAIESTAKLKISGGTIAYNACANNGGAIVYSQSNTTFFEISGGTIEHNVAGNKGGAIYISSGNTSMLTLSGNPSIPAETDGSNDIFVKTDSYSHYPKITIGGAIDNAFTARITYGYYDTRMKPLVLGTDVTDTDLATECEKFDFPSAPLTGNSGAGEEITIDAKWYIDDTGAMVRYNKLAPDAMYDIVLNDGTAITGKYVSKMTTEEKSKAIAVIFYAGSVDGMCTVSTGHTVSCGRRLLGVGFEQESLVWSSKTDIEFTGLDSPDDYGTDNWGIVCSQDAEGTSTENVATNYPAYNWVHNYANQVVNLGTVYASEWYIPSSAELSCIVEGNIENINRVLKGLNDVGAKTLSTSRTSHYMSANLKINTTTSTQGVYYRIFSDSNSIEGGIASKKDPLIVLPIHEFNPTIPTTDLVTITKPTYTVLEVVPKQTDSIYTFTADDGFAKYTWYVDNEEQTETSNILTLDTSTWRPGIYDIRLEAKLGSSYSSTYYSYTDQITVSGN